MKYLFTFSLCLLSVFHVHAQSVTLFGIDASNFPIMKAKFYAYDAAGKLQRPSANELTLTENGTLRVITSVTCPTPLPPVAISSVLTVDVSGSMSSGSGSTPNIDLAKAAAKAWIQGLPAGLSECALTSFDDNNYLNQDFTTDRTKLQNSLATLTPNGGTNYNMGFLQLLAGSLQISKRGQYKRVIIFLSDGLPNFMPNTAAIIAEAKSQNCMVFAVTLGMPCPQTLQEISTQTGGLWFENVTTAPEAENVYRRILQIAQDDTPCEVTWNSTITCQSNFTDIELQWQGVKAQSNYQIPKDAVASLVVQPAFMAFGGQMPKTYIDRIITLTSVNDDCTITDIIRNFGSIDFTVVNGTFPLFIPKNTSKPITLRFTPTDSAMRYASFDIITDKCNASFSCNGGFRLKKNTNPTIKLTHPNGGEVFVAGTDTLITWDGIASSDSVILEYSYDAGVSWNSISTSAHNLQHTWKSLPKPASNRCIMRVRQPRFGGSNTPGTVQFDLTDHISTVTNVRWSPDGSKVVTTSSDMTAKIWSAYNGKLLFTLQGHFSKIYDACWSPDGSRIATASQDYTARIWSAETGTQLYILEGHKGHVSTIDWSPDGMRIATGGSDKTAIIWSAVTGALLHTLTKHTDYVNEVRWGPDGMIVATAGYDSTAMIWDAASGSIIHKLQGHSSSVNTARWSPDGLTIATGSYDQSVKIWDVSSGNLLQTLIGNNNIGINSAVYSVNWKPDGTQIITSGMDHVSRIWDVASGTQLFTLAGHSSNPTISSGWSPDGKLILTAGSSEVYATLPENKVIVWDASTGKLLYNLNGHTRYLTGVNWSPDGSQIATSSDDHTAKIWVIDATPIQEDTSDNLFSIVVPQVTARSIDMKQCLVGNVKDSLFPAFVTNSGSYQCRIDSIYFTGSDAGSFAVVSGIPKYELLIGDTKRTEFRFIPNRTGLHTATINIITQSDTLYESIIGEGIVPALTILNTYIDFGQVPIGSKKDTIRAVTIKNNRGVPLTITSTRHAGPNDVDFTTLAGGGNFNIPPYDTARLDLEYFPKSEGRTSGQLLFEYNDLGSPARVQLFGEGVPLRTTIIAQDITAQAGEKVNVILTLQKQTGMHLTGAPTKWYARIHYNKSILFDEQSGNVCPGTTDSCVMEFTGDYNPNTTELLSYPCIITLGNTDHSTIVIDTFIWMNSGIATEVFTENGSVTLTGVCEDGGVRLFIPALNSSSLSTRPNPAQDNLQIQYGLREPLAVTLELLTLTGQVVQTIINNQVQLTGQYTLTSDLSLLGNGVYLLRLQTNKEMLTTRVDVVR